MPRITKKQKIAAYLHERQWSRVGESEWTHLRSALPDISETVIRDGCAEAGIEIDPPWRGIRQHTLAELEQSLAELSVVYAERADLRGFCRSQVITAKDRARWLSARLALDEARRAMKSEMVEWMLIWLGDPAMFPEWVRLRQSKIAAK